MNKTTKKSKNKFVLIATVSIIIVAAIYGGIAYGYSYWPFSSSAPSSSDNTLQPTNSDQTTQDTGNSSEDAGNKQTFNDNQVNSNPDNNPVTVNFDATLSQQEANVIISTRIMSAPSGQCTAVIQNGSNSVTKKAEIMYAPEYSTCAGFTVPVTDLGSGAWKITLSITSNSQTVSKNFEIIAK